LAWTVLVTGGAGFVGSTLAIAVRHAVRTAVIAFDNLRRRGSDEPASA
jgi:CDP-paratose 2-epimerase